MSGGNILGRHPGFYRGLELLPVHLYILTHLRKAGVDYAKMMIRVSGLPRELIEDTITDLLELGLIERDSGSAIKRSRARFKKAFEVHKHHTYYSLSRRGELFIRSIDEKWLSQYFNTLLPNGWEVVRALADSKNLQDANRKIKIDDKTVEELKVLHFVSEKGNKTDFFKRLCEFLGV